MPDTSPSKGFLARMFGPKKRTKDIELPQERRRDPKLPKDTKKKGIFGKIKETKERINPFDRFTREVRKSKR